MDALTFIAAIVRGLAWPLAVILVAALFREQIRDAIRAISLLKFKDLEIRVEREASKLALSAEAALPAVTDIKPEKPPPGALPPTALVRVPLDLAALADEAPDKAIVLAWDAVSRAAVAALTKRGVRVSGPKGTVLPTIIEGELRRVELLNDAQVDVLKQLRNLRVTAGRLPGSAITATAALEYITAAYRLIAALDSA